MNWAKTVAAAAPNTPILGINPIPNIRTGSRKRFITRPIALILKGVLLFPVARMTAVHIGFTILKTINIPIIKRYISASCITSGIVNLKNSINGFLNVQRITL